MSLKPPILHAISAGPSGAPSSVVTIPTTSWVLFGAITVTRNWSPRRPKEAGSSGPRATICGSTGSPYDLVAVITRNATGWMGASVPGGRTGRWTPFWPPPARNARRFVKLPNSGRYAADLAPVGRGSPICEMTTPISPAGTWTQGYRTTAYVGHSLNRTPGISSSACQPASPANAIGVSVVLCCLDPRLVTRPTSAGPITTNDRKTT